MSAIKHMIAIDAPPRAVWPLVSSGAGFAKWWVDDVIHEQAGEIAELGFSNRATVYRLRVVSLEAPERAEWLCETGTEWTGTRLTFLLMPVGDGCSVRFTHSDWARETDYFFACNTVWGALMFRLKSAAEGKEPGPLFRKAAVSR